MCMKINCKRDPTHFSINDVEEQTPMLLNDEEPRVSALFMVRKASTQLHQTVFVFFVQTYLAKIIVVILILFISVEIFLIKNAAIWNLLDRFAQLRTEILYAYTYVPNLIPR